MALGSVGAVNENLTLFVASTGGHLSELHQLAPSIEPARDSRVWATFDTPQSRSLLSGERVEYVRFMAPREWRVGVANLHRAKQIFRHYRPRRIVSTGAGIALSFLPLGRLFSSDVQYIESAARISGPSVTGRLLSLTPGIQLRTQYKIWESRRWRFDRSVFDSFTTRQSVQQSKFESKILVLLGSLDFPFTRLVDRLSSLIPDDVTVRWQVGYTPVNGSLIGEAREWVSAERLASWASDSSAIVAHAGVGSALLALQNGIRPILVPRRHEYGEHVDDHQAQLADELQARGLAFHREVDQLDADLLLTNQRVIQTGKVRDE